MRRTLALSTAALLAVAAAGTASATAGSGHATAVTEATSLLALAPTISGATATDTAPAHALAKAPPAGYTHLVTRRAYWTVMETARKALHDLAATDVAGLTLSGSGYSSGPNPDRRVYFAQWYPDPSPTGIAWAALTIEIAPTGTGTSGIAAFGQAVPAPPRPAGEIVASGASVRVALRTAKGHVVRGDTVTGAHATTLIDDFNGLSVIPPGAPPRPCPLDSGRRELVTFRWADHVLKVSSGFCGYVDVSSHGRSLKALNDGGSFDQDIRADLAPTGQTTPAMRAAKGRPRDEHVPLSLHRVQVSYRNGPIGTKQQTATVHGKRAHKLVASFDRLAVEPSTAVHCNVAGGPQTTVTFRAKGHTWVATESACTDVRVTRDGHRLPTLVPTPAWDSATSAALTR